MKYMNHLRKLALLSSLALSFTLHADGTLPLPGMKDRPIELIGIAKMNQVLTEAGNIRLEMKVDSTETAADISEFGNPCELNATYHAVGGTVTHGILGFDVAGVCIPKGATSTSTSGTLPRTVVATDGSRLLLLSGPVTYSNNVIVKFSGNLILKGATEEIMKFELNPIN
jgi:hypothetical protein